MGVCLVLALAGQDLSDLLRRMADDSFEVREKATREALELPASAETPLLEALRSAADPEVRWRLQETLRLRRIKFRAERFAAALPESFARRYAGLIRRASSEDPDAQASLVREFSEADHADREIRSLTEDERRTLLAALFDNSEGEVRRDAFKLLFPDGEMSAAFADRIVQALDETDPDLCSLALRAQGKLEGRRDSLLPWLRSPRPELRAAAAAGLGEKKFIQELRGLLRDPAAPVRAAAIDALRAADARECAGEVAALLGSNETVDRAALEALKGWPSEPLVDPIARLIDGPATRALALEIFEAWKIPAVARHVAPLLSDDSARAWACRILVGLRAGEELVPLLSEFDSLSDELKDGVLEAIRASRPKSAAEPLARLVENEEFRGEALALLADIGGPPELFSRFLEDENHRVVAVRGVRASGSVEHAARLAAHLKTDDDLFREACVEAILAVRPPIGPEVENLLSDETPEVRAAALRVIGTSRAGALMLRDGDARVRELAAGLAPVRNLLSLLTDPESEVRRAAARRLQDTADEPLRAQIAKLLDHDSCDVRELAVRILRDRRGLRDPAWSVRAAAAEVLRTPEDLLELLKDPAPAVQEAAAESLARMGRGRDVLAAARRAPALLWGLNPEPLLRDARAERPGGATAASIRLQAPPGFKTDPSMSLPTAEALLRAFSLANDHEFAFILEKDRVRALPIDEAIEHWNEVLK
jgi:HEAT repeat protein